MVLPLRTGDEHVLEGIALRGQLPPLNPAELRAISELASEVPNALQYIKMVYGRNSVFAGHPSNSAPRSCWVISISGVSTVISSASAI